MGCCLLPRHPCRTEVCPRAPKKEITVPAGFYVLQVKAFVRVASPEVAYSLYDRKIESVVAYAYANDVKYPIKSLFDESGAWPMQFTAGAGIQYGNGLYYANDLASAGAAFDNINGYVNDVYVYVPASTPEGTGTLEYGIVNNSYVKDVWMVYGAISIKRLDRAQYIFNGTVAEDKENWKQDYNWDREAQPNKDNAVIIRSDVTISDTVSVYSLTIENDAKVMIAPAGGLTVGKGGIKGAETSNLFLKADTVYKSSTRGQTGFLRISPECEEAMPNATVEMFSTAYWERGGSEQPVWQCVGAPIVGDGKTIKVKDYVTKSYAYSWDEKESKWVNNRASLLVTPFEGFETTQYKKKAGLQIDFAGQLVSVSDKKIISLLHEGEGYNLLANSFSAPISIEEFKSGDFTNADETIYILNAGTKDQSSKQKGGYNAPGKWIPVPIKSAEALATEGYPTLISSMQGFWIKVAKDTPKEAEASLTLDYSRLVWGVDYSDDRVNKPLRARKHNAEQHSLTGKLQVNVYSDQENDFIFMLESDNYDATYENGYDARKIPSGGMDVFTVEGEEQLGVDATNSIIGTRIGVRTGEATSYTMSFSHLNEREDLALLDMETNETTDIDEGTEYTFNAEPNSEILGRFQIVQRAQAPTNPTGIEGVESGVKAHKFIKNNKVYILKNGLLYDMMGAIVR